MSLVQRDTVLHIADCITLYEIVAYPHESLPNRIIDSVYRLSASWDRVTGNQLTHIENEKSDWTAFASVCNRLTDRS